MVKGFSRDLPSRLVAFGCYNMAFNKAKLLIKYFGMYGKGNFDLTVNEIQTILDILNKKNEKVAEEWLKSYYEHLEKQRMGEITPENRG